MDCRKCAMLQVSLMYQTDAQPALPATSGASRYSLQVVDSLVSIGIVRDLVTGRAQQAAFLVAI